MCRREVLIGLKSIPKETKPPFVLKSSIASPLSSGGGIGDQMQWGALAHAFEFATSISSCWGNC